MKIGRSQQIANYFSLKSLIFKSYFTSMYFTYCFTNCLHLSIYGLGIFHIYCSPVAFTFICYILYKLLNFKCFTHLILILFTFMFTPYILTLFYVYFTCGIFLLPLKYYQKNLVDEHSWSKPYIQDVHCQQLLHCIFSHIIIQNVKL